MPTTQRLLTDETGQALVTAVNNIVAAVKPNATEIQMSSSDTTTVATAITNINDKIGTVPSGQTVEGQITTLNSNFTSFLGNDTTSDCNSETATGFKKAINSTANTPYAGHFVVFTFNYNQNEMIQFAMSTNANAIYFRYYDSSWSSWKMLGWNS